MPSDEAIIKFYFLKNSISLKNRNDLKRFLVRLFENENKELAALNYIFCSDSYLLGINKKHLSHNYYTDIITFPLSNRDQPIIADIYISVDRVKKNAIKFKNTITQELHRVIFHGALHLCGYNDKQKAQAARIRNREDYYLDLYFA